MLVRPPMGREPKIVLMFPFRVSDPPFCIPGDVNWWIVLGGVVVQRESAVAKVLELALSYRVHYQNPPRRVQKVKVLDLV